MNNKVIKTGAIKEVINKKFVITIVCSAVILSLLSFSYVEELSNIYGRNSENYSLDFSSKNEEYVVASEGEIDEKDISRVHATYRFDVKKVENVVSDADYTFVAKVDKVLGTVYKFPVCLEDKTVSMPYTKIRLKVVKNVKGKLKEGRYIEVLKAGGKEKKGSKYIVYDNDVVCTKGGTYLFSTYVQKDGSLLATGANSTIKTNKNYKDNVSYSKACSSKSKKLTKSRSRYKIKNSKVYM